MARNSNQPSTPIPVTRYNYSKIPNLSASLSSDAPPPALALHGQVVKVGPKPWRLTIFDSHRRKRSHDLVRLGPHYEKSMAARLASRLEVVLGCHGDYSQCGR